MLLLKRPLTLLKQHYKYNNQSKSAWSSKSHLASTNSLSKSNTMTKTSTTYLHACNKLQMLLQLSKSQSKIRPSR